MTDRNETDTATGRPWRNFYGRRHGKTLRKGHARLIEENLGPLSLPGVSWEENPGRRELDLAAQFGPGREIWLEIGFGAGEHLVHQAALNPEVALIGAEPFINGVAALLARIEAAGLRNIALHPGDVRDLFDVLPAASVSRVFLLYPDPWPKTRHHRRRFVVPETVSALGRVMAPGSVLRLATDIPDYVRQALDVVPSLPEFGPPEQTGMDWHEPWPDWTRTRYEAKAIREGRVPHYLSFPRL